MKILITDGSERTALAAARSLVASGYEVHVAARSRYSLAGVSRGVRPHAIASDSLGSAAEFVAELDHLVRAHEIALLLPVTDASAEAVLAERRGLPAGLLVPLPELAVYRRAADKLEVMELARASGFAAPETVVLESSSPAHIPGGIFPAVVKPHRSVVTVDGKARRVGVAFVDDQAACRRALAALPPSAFPVLLQRRVAGEGQGLFALRWDGKTIARFAHRRLRDKPPAGGVSVYREAIALDPDLVRASERLLQSLDWQGVAMIECRRDSVTGRHVIMEVNGRLWGSLQLAVDAGVDFPRLLVQCATGREYRIQNGTPYRIGIRSRWFWGDVDQLYLRFTHSARDLGLPPEDRSRLRALRDFLSTRPGRDRSEIWRWRDPAPFLLETTAWIRGALAGHFE
ncbi:MAG TPA: ATP-grasp domain-containing protein [Gemmatimonadales bacterium]|nr:ATP-grasp domain-containing protein [Gemmatimonadales bacterium]